MEIVVFAYFNIRTDPKTNRRGNHQMAYPEQQIFNTLELNLPKKRMWAEEQIVVKPRTPSEWFAERFPEQIKQYGCPFLELRESTCDGFTRVMPISINVDFFAAMLGGDLRLGHSVVYFEPEMQFYYLEPVLQLYKPTSAEKLQNLYRAMLIRCAQELNNETHKLNLFHEFRSDKTAKAIVNRAKSILAADHTFFSATSPHQRIRGIELYERVARRFVDELLTHEPGQILRLADAYAVFRGLLKQRELPDIKRSDFKAVVGPLITSNFNVALRNDLNGAGVRGWKNVKMIQTVPG